MLMPKLSRARQALCALLLLPLLIACGSSDQRTDDGDAPARFVFGDDVFLSGLEVRVTGEDIASLYMSGEDLLSEAGISDSVYAAGRTIELLGAVGGNVHAAGMDVRVAGPVAGDAKLTGYDVELKASLGGDLLVSGFRIAIDAPVAGYALLSGRNIDINSVINGDLSVYGKNVSFGPEARVLGKLLIHERDPGSVQVPDYVADLSQIERRSWRDHRRGNDFFDFFGAFAAFIGWIVFITLLATVVAVLAPNYLIALRTQLKAAPFKTLGYGCFGLSAALGSVIVLGLTFIGAVLIPLVVLVVMLSLLAAYALVAYWLGELAWSAVRKNQAQSLVQRLLAALVGAVLISILGLIPVLGWIAVFVLILMALGVFTTKIMGVRLFVKEAAESQ